MADPAGNVPGAASLGLRSRAYAGSAAAAWLLADPASERGRVGRPRDHGPAGPPGADPGRVRGAQDRRPGPRDRRRRQRPGARDGNAGGPGARGPADPEARRTGPGEEPGAQPGPARAARRAGRLHGRRCDRRPGLARRARRGGPALAGSPGLRGARSPALARRGRSALPTRVHASRLRDRRPRPSRGPVRRRPGVRAEPGDPGRALSAGWRFDPALGPDGTARYRTGGETELLLRLSRAGCQPIYLPRARVRHQIRPEQLGTAWLYGRAFRQGRSQWVRAGAAPGPCILGAPRALLARLVRTYAAFLVARLARNPLTRFDRGVAYWRARGALHESRRASSAGGSGR